MSETTTRFVIFNAHFVTNIVIYIHSLSKSICNKIINHKPLQISKPMPLKKTVFNYGSINWLNYFCQEANQNILKKQKHFDKKKHLLGDTRHKRYPRNLQSNQSEQRTTHRWHFLSI